MRSIAMAALLSTVLVLHGCSYETVAYQQTDRDANHIIVQLAREGLDARRRPDDTSRTLRFKVDVPSDQMLDALEVLEKYNLPRVRVPDTKDILDRPHMIPTQPQLEAQRVAGIEGDIVNALRDLPRVVEVKAAVSIPRDNPLRDATEAIVHPKASVFVVYEPGQEHRPPVAPSEFKRFVQAKLPELTAEGVQVVLVANSAVAEVELPTGCEPESLLFGISVCQGSAKGLLNLVLVAAVAAGLLAGLAIIAVLRAMRYRRDLTRLTAELGHVGPRS